MMPVILERPLDVDEKVERWAKTLAKAKVSRWGGVISKPELSMQEDLRHTLLGMDCPKHILDWLIEYSHEKRWPRGLSKLETRQRLQGEYQKYVCRRVPGRQAVIVLYFENTHMPEEMILNPGILMAFNYGVDE